MSGNGEIKISISGGGNVNVSGNAFGANARAVTIENSQFTVELPRQFETLTEELRTLSRTGVIGNDQALILVDQAQAAKALLSDEAAPPEQKEVARGLLNRFIDQFKGFCSENHRKGVFSCLQAIAAICGLPLAGLA